MLYTFQVKFRSSPGLSNSRLAFSRFDCIPLAVLSCIVIAFRGTNETRKCLVMRGSECRQDLQNEGHWSIYSQYGTPSI
jgi:hypothetical protein